MTNSETQEDHPATEKEWSHRIAAKSRLGAFFEDPNAGLFVLKGKYGSGKSYFLREILLKQEAIRKKFKFVSFTSVFGVNDLKELTDTAIGSIQFGKVKGKAANAIGNAVQSIAKPFLGGVNAQVSAKSVMWAIANQSGLLLVIDDIDRKGPKLRITEIIGFANSLVEHSSGDVRVIFVVNEDELEKTDLEEWESLREKFIDGEFGFHPSPKELAEHYVKTPDLKEPITEIHEAFEAPNIRTMLKIERLVNSARQHFEENDIEFTCLEISHTAQLSALFLRSGKRFPVMEIIGFRPVWSVRWEKDKAIVGDESKDSRQEFLKDSALIEFHSIPRLDPLLIQFFLNGTINPDDLAEFKEHISDTAQRERFENAESALWDHIHLSFKDTSEAFLKQAKQTVADYAGDYSLESMCRLTDVSSELGGDPAPLWGIWLDHHADALKGDVLKQTRNALPEALKDRLPEAIKVDASEVDPAVYMSASLEGSISREVTDQLELLAEWTQEDWVEWLESTDYDDVLPGVQNLLRTQWNDFHYQTVQKNIRQALRELVEKSAINRVRSSRYFPDVLQGFFDAEQEEGNKDRSGDSAESE